LKGLSADPPALQPSDTPTIVLFFRCATNFVTLLLRCVAGLSGADWGMAWC